jgi:hypothetical protein
VKNHFKADWLLLNGVKVDRAKFEASLDVAYGQAWEKTRVEKVSTCLICEASIACETTAYVAPRGILCAPCFERFVGPSTPP